MLIQLQLFWAKAIPLRSNSTYHYKRSYFSFWTENQTDYHAPQRREEALRYALQSGLHFGCDYGGPCFILSEYHQHPPHAILDKRQQNIEWSFWKYLKF